MENVYVYSFIALNKNEYELPRTSSKVFMEFSLRMLWRSGFYGLTLPNLKLSESTLKPT